VRQLRRILLKQHFNRVKQMLCALLCLGCRPLDFMMR